MLGFYLVMPLMIIIITGNQLRARGFYTDGDISTLMKTLFWVVLPPLLFRTTYTAGVEAINQPNLFIGSTLCYLLTIAVAWCGSVLFAHRGDRRRTAVAVLACFRSNNLYLGFPVIQLAMGEAGMHQASVYMAVIMVDYQFISLLAAELVSYGRIDMRSIKKILGKIIRNPLLIACVLGFGVAVTGIPVPAVFDEAFKLVSASATAVALLALGGTLDLSRIGRIMSIFRRTWFDTLVKMVINPALMYGMLLIFPVPEALFKVTVMLTMMPTAVNTFIIARGMGMDSDYAADLVASATISGVIAIPAWAYIMHIV